MIGKDENLNAVKPDTTTGGEALASLLREGQCPLKTLRVSWNMIRMEGAFELCSALPSCESLVHVDLSFNALGRDSGVALGASIMAMPVTRRIFSFRGFIARSIGLNQALSFSFYLEFKRASYCK